mgnify:CR=1 FL=1
MQPAAAAAGGDAPARLHTCADAPSAAAHPADGAERGSGDKRGAERQQSCAPAAEPAATQVVDATPREASIVAQLAADGRLADAELHARAALAACDAALGEAHPATLASAHELASLLLSLIHI